MGFSSHPSQACSRLRRTRISAHPVPPVRFIAILPPDLFSSGWPALAFAWLKRTVELIATWTSGINLPAIRTPRRPFARANYLPLGRRSCHGLCLLQGCGHTLVHPRGLDPAWIVNLRKLATSDFDAAASPASVRLGETLSRSIAARSQFSLSLQRWRSQSARGLRRLLPGQSRPGELPPIASIAHSRLAIASSRARPLRSPALQRVEGADALLFRTRSSLARRSSLSEVLHRP